MVTFLEAVISVVIRVMKFEIDNETEIWLL